MDICCKLLFHMG